MAEEKQNKETQSSYRSIFKATSLFGGVQVYKILVNVIRSKIMAVLLGPEGIGVLGLYMSITEVFKNTTSMGLSSSAVRDISQNNDSNEKLRRTISVVSKLVFLTGSLGMFLMIILSPVLSIVSFGDYTYIIPLMVLSITLLVDQISAGQTARLQGLRRLKDMALSTAIGSTLGLLLSIPLFYYFRQNGIVPSLIVYSFVSLILTWFFCQKIKVDRINIKLREAIKEGSTMLKMGASMSISLIFSSLAVYLLRGFIRYKSGIEEVGIFTAGYMLMVSYAGLVFNAMGTDFYPRLAQVNKDNRECRRIMNQQGEIGLIILAPLLTFCVVFVPFIVSVLYSDEFNAIFGYVKLAALGMFIKMASWCISYVFVAKAEARLYITMETSSYIIGLILDICGYLLGGLTGMGISFILHYIIYFFIVYIIAHRKYEFKFFYSFCKIFLIQTFLIIASIMISFLLDSYYWGVVLILICTSYSIVELNKRIELKSILRAIWKKNL